VRQIGRFDDFFLLYDLRGSHGGLDIRPRWQIGWISVWVQHFDTDLDGGRPKRIFGIVVLQVLQRQRDATQVDHRSAERGERPHPQGDFLRRLKRRHPNLWPFKESDLWARAVFVLSPRELLHARRALS
jgi:hypothetical protein